VVVEGPYGGMEERLSGFDDVLLIAGGVGGTFVWPIAEQLTRMKKPFRMVWSVKSQGAYLSSFILLTVPEASTWFGDSEAETTNVQVHITDYGSDPKTPHSPGEKDGDSSLGDNGKSIGKTMARHYGRPDVPRIVRDFGRDATTRSRVAVIGKHSLICLALLTRPACGPASLITEVGQGCREVQWSIATGRYEVSEMWLHRETFSW
jgi:hypothetical protein